MSNRPGFCLPGHDLNEVAERKLLLSFLAAYSRQWNPRNLEAPWYSPWTQIFADLVAKHASLSVAPQSYLWYDLQPKSSESHTTPGPPHHLSTEDELLDDPYNDVGNDTLDSITTISVPNWRDRHRIPDIAVTRQVSLLRAPQDGIELEHLSRRVTYVGLPLVAELKSSGARCGDIQTSLKNAVVPMTFARNQVTKQAMHLFKMYPHQRSVVLVAISGFWWSCRILCREEVPVDDPPIDEEEAGQEVVVEESDPTVPDQDGIHSDLMHVRLDSNEPSAQVLKENIYGFAYDTLKNLSERRALFYPVSHEPLALTDVDWSDYLLYGTPASNEMFSLIHDRLHSVVHVHYDGRLG